MKFITACENCDFIAITDDEADACAVSMAHNTLPNHRSDWMSTRNIVRKVEDIIAPLRIAIEQANKPKIG